jgi:hypothetical protein
MRKINWLLFTLSEDHSSFCLDKQQTITRYSPEPGWINNRIGGVMVSLLASNAVDRVSVWGDMSISGLLLGLVHR